MKGLNNMVIFGVSLLVVWLILSAVFPAIKAVTATGLIGILSAVLISSGVLALAKVLKVANFFPFKATALTVVALLGVGLFMGGLLGAFTSGIPGLSTASVGAPAAPIAPGTVATSGSCSESVAPDIKGTSATVTLNAYDLESNTPYSAAVDAGTVYIFKSDTIGGADNSNFITSTSDTTANGVTGIKVGDVISLAGGNSTNLNTGGYYIESVEGFCVTGQQNSINLKAHQWVADANEDVTVYDSTGSVELSAGTVGLDYTAAQGANSDVTYYWRIRSNTGNRALWLGGVGFAIFQNITNAAPTGNGLTLFSSTTTPQFLNNLNFQVSDGAANVGGTTNVSMSRSYTTWRLKSPVILHAFDEFKFPFHVQAGANDPVGAANTTTWSGVAGIVLDQAYARGSDGKMYLDIHDHAPVGSEANVGISEQVQAPVGGLSGFQMTLT